MRGVDHNEKRALLAALRTQVRALEAELEEEASSDARIFLVRERLVTEAEGIARVGSWSWHRPSNTVHWSDELYRIVGVDPGYTGCLIERFLSAVHPGDLERVRSNMGTLVEAGAAGLNEFRMLRPDGRELTVRARNAAVVGPDGVAQRFVGTVQDITDQREAERQRTRDVEMLRSAEALAGVGSYRWSPSSGAVVWSDQFKIIVGVPPDAPGLTLEDFILRLHLEDQTRLAASSERALKTGVTESLPVRLLRDDGSTRHLILQGRFLPDGELLGSALDVTELHRLQSELSQAQKLEALGRLGGGIAHDFNNILAVLKLGIEARPTSAAMLTELSTAIERGVALTRQLLAFSRKNVLEPRAVEVGKLLQQSVALVERLLGDAVRPRVLANAQPLTVFVDPAQLQHTLINLILNARDAMPSGGTIWLSASARHFDSPPPNVNPSLAAGDYVEIEVRDEGTGIDAAVLPHIFEPFFTTKPAGQGTGLGLTSVYGTVSQSGGGLGVRSRPGAGSTFQIYLPRSTLTPEQSVEAPVRAAQPGRGERILVVDDLPAIRRVLAVILENAGFEPVCVEDLRALVSDAGRIAASCKAMITDLDMPIHTGPELARILWRHVPELPVLFMSGHPELELPSGGQAATAFLAKPFSSDAVVEQLTRLLALAPRTSKGE